MIKKHADLNFRVASTFRHDFKKLVAFHNRTGVSILKEALTEWQRRHGGPDIGKEIANV